MRLIHSFPVTPLAYWLKMATLTPLFLVAPNALADLIDGRSKTIDGSVPAEEYRLINAASLTANGATTLEINAQTGSKVTLNGTTVNATGAANGVRLSASEATIANKSRVVSDNTGLSLIRTVTSASSATVKAFLNTLRRNAPLTGKVYLSFDGGQTWPPVAAPNFPLLHLTFVD